MPDIPAGWEKPFCEKYGIYPQVNDGTVKGVLISPRSDLSILSFLKFREKKILPVTVVDDSELGRISRGLFGEAEPTGDKFRKAEHRDDLSIIHLIDEIIGRGIAVQASDIHFEPFEKRMDCRYRIDGVLRKDREIPWESTAEVIARLKIMSGLDISEKRRPQDGRIRFNTGQKVVDIRVSVLPTDFGEKAVLRLLDKESLRLDLDLFGFSEQHRQLLEEKISLPNGMILVTGPTGSGKTTTLYAVLNRLSSPDVNITTIEDPIEYNLAGINQTQIKPEIDVTFARALRAILRQDPDIIMVGEIRDKETLDQAVRAALTGHLVLSTLHTNDAVSAITRMLDLGAESYLIASVLKLIIAQRLVQTICEHCRGEDNSPEQRAVAHKLGIGDDEPIMAGRGCRHCGQTGFAGRKAIYEMLSVDEAMAEMISGGVGEGQIRRFAQDNGLSRLKDSGLALIRSGTTTPIEVYKAVAL